MLLDTSPVLTGGNPGLGQQNSGKGAGTNMSCSGLWYHGQHSQGETVLQENGEDVLLSHWSPCQLTLSWAKGGLCSVGLT